MDMRAAGLDQRTERREVAVHRRRADPGPLGDLNVGRGGHTLLIVQCGGSLDDALARGV